MEGTWSGGNHELDLDFDFFDSLADQFLDIPATMESLLPESTIPDLHDPTAGQISPSEAHATPLLQLPVAQNELSSAPQAARGFDGDGGTYSASQHAKASLSARAKSRTAQRKYRNKQKVKLASTQTELETVRIELQAVKLEKEALAQRAVQLNVAHSHPDTRRLPTTGSSVTTHQSSGTESISQSAGPQYTMAEATPTIWWLDQSTREALATDLGIDGRLHFSVHPDPFRNLTHEDIATMPSSTLADLWQVHVQGYAELLLEMNEGTSDTVTLRLQRAATESGQLWAAVLGCHPSRLRAFQEALYAKASDAIEVSTEELVASLQLNEEQRQQMRALRLVLLQGTGILQAQREALMANLRAQTAELGIAESRTQLPEVIRTVDALRDSCRRDHCLFCKFSMTLWTKIFSAPQIAIVNIKAWPVPAPALALIQRVAVEAGEELNDVIIQDAAAAAAKSMAGDACIPPTLTLFESVLS